MSDKPEIELDLDLQLLPAWARQPQTTNRYAEYEGGGDRDRRGPRGRGGGGGGSGPGGPRRDAPRWGDRRQEGRGPRPEGGPGRGGPGRADDARGPRGDRSGPGGRRFEPARREPVEEMPEGVTVDLIPEPSGVDSLTKQIRQTGRAYPLFDIGHLILKRPDRYLLEFRISGNNPDGTPRQFYACSLDDSIWMSEGEAVRHVLSRHFDTFYQTEKIPMDPPKGTYTFVAQCGMSGTILGPPNLHDYQAKLQRLHSERFSRMAFDVYKSRVRIVRDEAVVKQWIEEQSFKFEYVCLNVAEPLKLPSREAVEQHFRQVHLPNIIRPVSSHTVRTAAARDALPPPLRRLSRREFDLQQRFPLKLVTRLSDDFAHRGLHFFKVNKTILHVAVARPRYLDLEVNPVSDGIRRIMEAIEATPSCTRRKLLEALGVSLPATAESGAAPESDVPPSPELQAIVTDLHWLIHEGHVIEFANGLLEAAKKPVPRPQQPSTPRPPREPGASRATASAAAPVETPAAEAPAEGAPSSDATAESGTPAATEETQGGGDAFASTQAAVETGTESTESTESTGSEVAASGEGSGSVPEPDAGDEPKINPS